MKSWLIYFVAECLAFLFLVLWTQSHRSFGLISNGQSVGNENRSKALLVLSAMPLFLLLAMRYQVGRDYKAYSNAYTLISQYGFFESIPSGFVNWLGNGFIFLCKMIMIFAGSNFLWFHAVIASLSIFFLYKAIFRNSAIPLLSLFIYLCDGYYYQIFNQSRQGLALLIVFTTFEYILDKKMVPFIITVIAAALVHPSALIFLPAFFLAKIELNLKVFVTMMVIGVFIIFAWQYVEILVSFTQYSIYTNSQYDVESVSTTVLRAIYRGGLLTFCLFFRKSVVKNYPKANALYTLCACSIILQIMSLKSYIFSRTVLFYYFGMLLLIPYVIKSIQYKHNRIIIATALLIVFLIGHVYYFVTMADYLLAPFYKTFIGQGLTF